MNELITLDKCDQSSCSQASAAISALNDSAKATTQDLKTLTETVELVSTNLTALSNTADVTSNDLRSLTVTVGDISTDLEALDNRVEPMAECFDNPSSDTCKGILSRDKISLIREREKERDVRSPKIDVVTRTYSVNKGRN